MKILVTGSSGQVASSLVELAPRWPAIELHTVGRPKFDLTDRYAIIKAIESAKPDLVISAAAYTAVDRAEDEPELAHAINVTGAAYVAEAASQVGAGVLHLSTDYIFSGEKSHPYDERCPADPRTVYGLTKLKGEEAVASANPRHIILRTSWVYSPFGANFVKTMLGLAATADTVRVVSDQWGNPTSALDIAASLAPDRTPPERRLLRRLSLRWRRRHELVVLRKRDFRNQPDEWRAGCRSDRNPHCRVPGKGAASVELPPVLRQAGKNF